MPAAGSPQSNTRQQADRLTRRKSPDSPSSQDLRDAVSALERLLIATAAPEADRDPTEEEAAWAAGRRLVDRLRASRTRRTKAPVR